MRCEYIDSISESGVHPKYVLAVLSLNIPLAIQNVHLLCLHKCGFMGLLILALTNKRANTLLILAYVRGSGSVVYLYLIQSGASSWCAKGWTLIH